MTSSAPPTEVAQALVTAFAASPLFSCLTPAQLGLGGLGSGGLGSGELRSEAFPLVRLTAGEVLFRQGESGDLAYLVVAGVLGLYRSDVGQETQLFRKASCGELIGEYALLCGEPRSATGRALVDCTLLAIDRSGLQRLLDLEPELPTRLIRQLALAASRGREDLSGRPLVSVLAPSRLLANAGDPALEQLIAALRDSDSVAIEDHRSHAWSAADQAAAIVQALEQRRPTVFVVDRLDGIAPDHWPLVDRTLLVCRGNALTPEDVSLCGRGLASPMASASAASGTEGAGSESGDRAAGDCAASGGEGSGSGVGGCGASGSGADGRGSGGSVDLVRIWPAQQERPERLAQRERFPGLRHTYNVREDRPADFRRTARCLLGMATVMVLGGGGAKGFAHLGALRALEEQGSHEIDMIYGISIGSFIGSLYALGHPIDSMRRILIEVFVRQSPYSLTLPIHSLFRYNHNLRKAERILRHQDVSDTWIPFRPGSVDLTSNQMVFWHRHSLMRTVIASMSIPGLAPPVPMPAGGLHVDGAVLDNLPILEARRCTSGRVIAISLDHGEGQRTLLPLGTQRSWLWRLLQRLGLVRGELPAITMTILQSMLCSARLKSDLEARFADLLLKPNLTGVGILEWSAHEQVEQEGYQAMREALSSAAAPSLGGAAAPSLSDALAPTACTSPPSARRTPAPGSPRG